MSIDNTNLNIAELHIMEVANIDRHLINYIDHINDKEIRLKVLRLMAQRQNLMNGISGSIQCIKEDMIDSQNQE